MSMRFWSKKYFNESVFFGYKCTPVCYFPPEREYVVHYWEFTACHAFLILWEECTRHGLPIHPTSGCLILFRGQGQDWNPGSCNCQLSNYSCSTSKFSWSDPMREGRRMSLQIFPVQVLCIPGWLIPGYPAVRVEWLYPRVHGSRQLFTRTHRNHKSSSGSL